MNIISTRKREHSRKPDELYSIIEQCSDGPYLEMFARHHRAGWDQWGNEIAGQGERGEMAMDKDSVKPVSIPELAFS